MPPKSYGGGPAKKGKKKTTMKPLQEKPSYCQSFQHKVQKAQEPIVIKPHEIFEGLSNPAAKKKKSKKKKK